jgi:hypothetical protein
MEKVLTYVTGSWTSAREQLLGEFSLKQMRAYLYRIDCRDFQISSLEPLSAYAVCDPHFMVGLVTFKTGIQRWRIKSSSLQKGCLPLIVWKELKRHGLLKPTRNYRCWSHQCHSHLRSQWWRHHCSVCSTTTRNCGLLQQSQKPNGNCGRHVANHRVYSTRVVAN